MTTKKLFLAMAVYKTVDIFTVQSLMKLLAEQMAKQEFGLAIKMHHGECPIGRARNDLTHEFLESDCTDMLFVDSDILFSYEQVKKILLQENDIVGGFYTKKCEGHVQPVCNTLSTIAQPDANGLIEVKFMGTGFLKISRKALEVMRQEKPELAYTCDRDGVTTKFDFWRMGVALDCVTGMKRWLSEDWQFCQFAIECGFKIWADASILVQHSGQALFPLRSQLSELYSPEQLQRMGIDLSEFRKDLDTSDASRFSPALLAPEETLKAAT